MRRAACARCDDLYRLDRAVNNSPSPKDTIAALATPPGRGGIAVLRVSGPAAIRIADHVAGAQPPPRQAVLRSFRDARGRTIDKGLLIVFPGPASYTGEDVVEFQGHGGPVVADELLRVILSHGARSARPGEFTERAYLNDRIDLAQAEAIADLIDSGSVAAARAAARSLSGEFSERVRALVDALTDLRVRIEAAIDFPEEEIDFLADAELRHRMAALDVRFQSLQQTAAQGAILRDGMNVVLAGRPNAGKSSLMNRLTGEDTAIVTHLPGTTRDLIKERIAIDGMPLHVIDTAGLRTQADVVEEEGIRRARRVMENADRVLLVTDASVMSANSKPEIPPHLPARVPITILRNKVDLTDEAPGLCPGVEPPVIRVSAATGAGIEDLRTHLKLVMGYRSGSEGALSARRRHMTALGRAHEHLAEASRQLTEFKAGELAAEELRLAQQTLGEVTGEVTSDDLLGQIFANFCIGK